MANRPLALAVTLAACGGPPDEPGRAAAETTRPAARAKRTSLATLAMRLPDGWTSTYDATADAWRFGSTSGLAGAPASVLFERAPAPLTAGPDALRHYMVTKVWERGTTAAIETRKPLSDGFATLLTVRPAADPDHPRRELHVVRELGSEWFRCVATAVVDDTTRDHALALCTSIKRS